MMVRRHSSLSSSRSFVLFLLSSSLFLREMPFYISGDALLYNNRLRVMPFVLASGKPTVGAYTEWRALAF